MKTDRLDFNTIAKFYVGLDRVQLENLTRGGIRSLQDVVVAGVDERGKFTFEVLVKFGLSQEEAQVLVNSSTDELLRKKDESSSCH